MLGACRDRGRGRCNRDRNQRGRCRPRTRDTATTEDEPRQHSSSHQKGHTLSKFDLPNRIKPCPRRARDFNAKKNTGGVTGSGRCACWRSANQLLRMGKAASRNNTARPGTSAAITNWPRRCLANLRLDQGKTKLKLECDLRTKSRPRGNITERARPLVTDNTIAPLLVSKTFFGYAMCAPSLLRA